MNTNTNRIKQWQEQEALSRFQLIAPLLQEDLDDCFLASNFPHFHRYDSLKSALYIHAVSKNINTFPKNQGRIRAAIAVEILDFTVMYR